MQEEVPMRLLKIKTLSETTYELRVPANMSIKDLRIKVQEISGVPADRQRMICMGQQLLDTKIVGDYAKDPEQPNWIHLVAKVQAPNPTEQNATSANQQQQQQPQQQQNNSQQANRRPIDMFGGNVQIQAGSVGDLNQILGNITNLFNPGRQQQPQQQQQGQNQQPQQQPLQSLFQAFQFPQANNLQQNNQQPTTATTNITANTTTNTTSNATTSVPAASTTRSNLVSNQQPITISRQIQLPHQELLNLGLACNNMMGPQSTFPGPPLPVIPNRGPAALIGSYLSNWQFQVQRTLPFVHRLAELLQREPYMTNVDDRNSTQALSLEVGRALNELVSSTQPLVGVLRDIHLNSAPGQVRVEQNPNSSAPSLIRPPFTHPMQQNQPNTSTNTTNTSQNNQSSNNTSGAQNQQTANFQQNLPQTGVNVSVNAILTNNPLLQGLINQPNIVNPGAQFAQNNNQQAPQQATINITQNLAPENNNNALNDLLSQISGGQNGEVRIGVMNSTGNNNEEIQIVGIGSTQIVNGDSNVDIQSVLGNLLGQNQNLNINSFNTNARPNNQANNAQQNGTNANQHVDEEWVDDEEDDENSIGIEMSSTINVNGNNPMINNLLSSLGIQQNGNAGFQSATISGVQASNLISQLTRPPQQNVSSTASTTQSVQQPQQQQQQQQPVPSSQPEVSNQISSLLSQFQNLSQPQQQGSQEEQPQPQQQQIPVQMNFASMLGGGNGGFNPLGMLMGGMGGGLGNMMNMTVNELIRENLSEQDQENESEADQLVQEIIGQLRISDLVQSFISGQFGFLNTIQPKMREIITQRQLTREQFTETMAEQLSQYLVVPEQHQSLVYEGLEPHNIALDILETRLPVLYDTIFRDFPEDGLERFSNEFTYQLKKIAGEVFNGIQECLHGGLNDLQIVFRTWVNEPIVRIMGEGSLALIDSFITSMLWEKLKALVLQYQHENAENNQIQAEEQKQNEGSESQSGQMEIEKPTQTREEQELDLLEDIENGLEKDQTRFDRYNILFSEQYLKGDFRKKNN